MTSKKNLKIFVVDDNSFCRELYAQHLKNIGFTDVHLFDNGQECINNLTLQPDIIFLDHEMEPLNGLEVLKKIKRFNPDIYLVVVSGQDNMQVSINALKYGAFDYIIKGEKDEELITKVTDKIIHIMNLMSKNNKDGKWPKFLSLNL